MKQYLALGALALGLTGCATSSTSVSGTIAQSVYALGSAYQAATIAESACISTGTCSATSAKALDSAAYAAVTPLVQAEASGGGVDATALAAAQEAVQAFETYVGSK